MWLVASRPLIRSSSTRASFPDMSALVSWTWSFEVE